MKKRWTLLLLAGLAAWVFWANTAIEVNEWTVASERLPAAFEGFRIAQVSDLHNAQFGPENETLLGLLKKAEPDIIVITGDLVDSGKTDVALALDFAAKAVQIAPCYYVSGNHEANSGQWTQLRQGLLDAGVLVLEDEGVLLEREGEHILLFGLQDPAFGGDIVGNLNRLKEEEGYTVLLSHRPELFGGYVNAGIDLVFSGHAHGGQLRIPFVGGLVAPGQGFFPEYDSGLYQRNGTAMLVSRGLGNSIIPLRVNNRPEILVAVLKRSQ